MTTDDERREVAARLRDWTWKSAPPECLLNQLVFGEDCPGTDDDPDTIGCAECECMAAKRLADLIDPGDAQFRDAAKAVDRDALQGLAGSLQIMAMHHDMTGQPDLGDTFRTIADKIREALGVES